MRINKVLFGLIMTVVLVAVVFVSYKITVSKLGEINPPVSEDSSTAEPTVAIPEETTADAATASQEITTAETSTEQVSTTGEAQQTTAVVTATSSEEIELLPVPSIVTVDEGTWYLTLMNKWYKVDSAYVPKLDEAVPGSGVYLDYRVAQAYSDMYDAAAADGVELYPCSGYRSLDRQTRNYNNLVSQYVGEGYGEEEAKAIAAKSIMVPGQSEHNFGLAMDIGWISNDFANSSAYAWLSEHAVDYGFIERYTKSKMDITGVYAEPWHWRYVGKDDAAAINASGQCLEEYLGMVN